MKGIAVRIGVNLQALRPGLIGGHEGYARNLLEWMPRVDRTVQLVLLCADYNAASFEEGPQVEVKQLSERQFAKLNARRLKQHGLDLWFCPLLSLEPVDCGLPSAVTIPDVQHEVYPEFFSAEILDWRRRAFARSVEGADLVLTPSQYSRKHIIEALGAPPDRVAAIPLDAGPHCTVDSDAEMLHRVRTRYSLPARYVYYPANPWPHKNHRTLLQALALFAEASSTPLALVLTGAGKSASREGGELYDLQQQLEDLQIELGIDDRVHHLGYLPAGDLQAVYAQAEALVFPSLFEGFGMPLLEAMRSGCPVISSSATSLPEVGGDAAVYFDPGRPDELCRELLALVDAPDAEANRQRMIERGFRRAATFSWEETARQTLGRFTALVTGRDVGAATPPTPEIGRHGDSPEPSMPLISIVTPSYQQGEFLERTLRSVLEQDYPRLEYIVIDGGSSDGSLELLAHYKELYPETLTYLSEPDKGQAHAVNKGLAMAGGEIAGWLNSDDTYEPGALRAVAAAFGEDPDCDLLYGRARYVDQEDAVITDYPTRPDFDWEMLAYECFLCQPAVFWRREIADEEHLLNEELQSCMDYDLWIRLGRDARIRFLDRYLASSRMYSDNKTLGRRSEAYAEIFGTVLEHYHFLPMRWALNRAHFLAQDADPVLNVQTITLRTFLVALGLVARHNWRRLRHWPRLLRELVTYARPITGAALRQVGYRRPRIVSVPAHWTAVRLDIEVEHLRPGTRSEIGIWLEGRCVATIDIDRRGTHQVAIELPETKRKRPHRLRLDSELIEMTHARLTTVEPCEADDAEGPRHGGPS
jgi:glycosyltransferase involved in cell wall biosynthesis